MKPLWIGEDGQRKLCAVCRKKSAVTQGRCAADMNYLRRHGYDRAPGESPRPYRSQPGRRRKHLQLTSPPNELEERFGELYVGLGGRNPSGTEGRRLETLTREEYNSLSDSARRELLAREYAGVARVPGERRQGAAPGSRALRAG